MKKLKYLLFGIMAIGVMACGDDDYPVPQASTVDASFSFDSQEKVVTFTNETNVSSDAGTVTYTWNFGDGTFSNQENPVHEYENVGIYDVSLVAVSENDVDAFSTQVVVLGTTDVRLFYINGSARQIGEVQGQVDFETAGAGYGIEYDAVNDKLYYATTTSLYRSDVDGSNEELVTDGFAGARDIALDSENGMVYIADRGANEIIQVNTENGEASVLYSTANGLGELPVAIDYYEGNLYITCVEIDSETVWKAAANGSGISNIIGYGAGGYGYGLAIDPVNEKIYFDNFEDGVILRADLDGSNVETVVAKVGRVYGMVIDATNSKLYFSDSGDGLIKKAELDGSDVVAVTLALDDPLGIVIVE
jgi:DNA-binding beta-propeller fold protein YncE